MGLTFACAVIGFFMLFDARSEGRGQEAKGFYDATDKERGEAAAKTRRHHGISHGGGATACSAGANGAVGPARATDKL